MALVIDFEKQLEKCKKMIYKFIHKFPHLDKEELYQEGLITLYEIMESYQESLSSFCLFFHLKINYRFIDIHNKFIWESNNRSKVIYELIPYYPSKVIDPFLLEAIKEILTPKQELWFCLHFIRELSYKEIALLENTTSDILKRNAQTAKKTLPPFLREYMREE